MRRGACRGGLNDDFYSTVTLAAIGIVAAIGIRVIRHGPALAQARHRRAATAMMVLSV